MANKDHGDCDCIFCNSKCPECGSINVDANFKLGFNYSNDHKNGIYISRVEDEVELTCNECGERICEDYFRDGDRLDKLLFAFCRLIDIPTRYDVKIDDKGKITVDPYVMISEPKEADEA